MVKGKVHTINLAAPPQVLTVDPGDIVRVVTEFDYAGPELKDARMISAIWHPTPLDPHDEIVRGNKTFTIPSSPSPGNHISVTMDLLVPSGEVGTDYGLYSSIRDIPGPFIYTNYYPNIITIEEVVPEYKGTISKKELEYNESRGAIPVSNVPQDKEGKVHVWGRNDMATNQKLGIHWIVKDPDGIVAEDYEDWESWPNTDPGKTHEFISPGRFDLNKPGPWTISISLAMNPASPVQVASYAGVLCTIKAVVPPAEYTLEVSIEPPGAGYVTKSPSKATYSAGEKVTLTAYPNAGYEFDHWGGWPAYPGMGSTSLSLLLTMDADWWVVAIFREVAPVVTTVNVKLKNPPSRTNRWGLSVYDWSGEKSLSTTVYSIGGEASFDIPPDWAFPLRFWISVIYYSSVTVLHQAQSLTPDWPNYIEEFIPDYGSYYYNVTTRKFEKYA